jgi:peptide/nickel transport system substrate-binding protein
LLRQADTYQTSPSTLAFGYDGESPWKDERLRQAVALLIDRETIIDLKTNRQKFAAEGLDLSIRYHSAVAAGWDGYWVNPLDEDVFGSASHFFKYDPAEAKKLMVAAGQPDGIETLLHYSAGSEYSPSYTRTAELISGMLHEGGVHARLDPREHTSDWVPNYQLGYTSAAAAGRQLKGFSGIIFRVFPQYSNVPAQLLSVYHRNGTRFIGMTPDGSNAPAGDPDVNRMIEDIRREFELKRQQELSLDFARFMAKKVYDIPTPSYASLGFTLSWPVIGNLGMFRVWPGGSPVTESALNHWIDTSKPPLATT